MRRYLILAAGMGDGHLQVGEQLRRRLVARGDTAEVVDILQVLPFGIGTALRTSYAAMLRHAPGVYEAIYRGFFVPRAGSRLTPDPLVVVSSRSVLRLIEQVRPDVVVSTFHLCGQITGRLRSRGQLKARSTVIVTDFVAHRMWLHPGNDAFVCVHPAVAEDVRRATGRPAVAAAPAVGDGFLVTDPLADAAAVETARSTVRAELSLPPRARVVLVSAGAWGSGDVLRGVRTITSADAAAVVLCGRNERLRHDVQKDRVVALGWRDDVPAVMRACDVLVENAAGQTATEAFAVGLPVVTFRPLPGHGRDGARRMAELGLSSYAHDDGELRAMIGELAGDSPRRRSQISAGRALFTADPVDFLDAVPDATPGPATPR